MAVHCTKAQVANVIEAFLNGTGGQWDWDEFTSCPISDPELDRVRQRCAALYDESAPLGHYCGEDGFAEMRRMVETLRV